MKKRKKKHKRPPSRPASLQIDMDAEDKAMVSRARRVLADAQTMNSEDWTQGAAVAIFAEIFSCLAVNTAFTYDGWRLYAMYCFAVSLALSAVFAVTYLLSRQRARAVLPATQDWARRCIVIDGRCDAFNERLKALEEFNARSGERYSDDLAAMWEKYEGDRNALLDMLDGLYAEESLLRLEKHYDTVHEPSARLTRELTEPMFISKVRIDNAALEAQGADGDEPDPRFAALEEADRGKSGA